MSHYLLLRGGEAQLQVREATALQGNRHLRHTSSGNGRSVSALSRYKEMVKGKRKGKEEAEGERREGKKDLLHVQNQIRGRARRPGHTGHVAGTRQAATQATYRITFGEHLSLSEFVPQCSNLRERLS